MLNVKENSILRSSVSPDGIFRVGVHKPAFTVANLRHDAWLLELGRAEDGAPVSNAANFPSGDVHEEMGTWIYEIINPLPFRGATFIDSGWAAARAADPSSIHLAGPESCSLLGVLEKALPAGQTAALMVSLPPAVRFALAANSTDPEELVLLARSCCRFVDDAAGQPEGLFYRKDATGRLRADIDDFELFETVANNPHLPDRYKQVMVLRPGVQGASEIVGEVREGDTHVFEYLRRNSYIAGGHYAANMADDAIRYHTRDLTPADMGGMRHLYYQRIYYQLAAVCGIPLKVRCRNLSEEELENLRQTVLARAGELADKPAALWGWNFGYDFSPSGYRLHASHQMIHMQYALVPERVCSTQGEDLAAFSSGDMVADAAAVYREQTGSDFFSDYLRCLRNNRRTGGGSGPASLIVYEDQSILLFVPKAQVSQWELQLMVIANDPTGQPVGNILEADSSVRKSLDRAILTAQHIYAALGARMVSSIEYGKRIGLGNGQRLFYSFLPKLPWAMGAFSEAQLRFICGHYPEDFAEACRRQQVDLPKFCK